MNWSARQPAPGAAAVAPVWRTAAGLWELDVTSRHGRWPTTRRRSSTASDIPADPLRVSVGGEPARYIDQQASMGEHLPVAVIVLAGTTFVLLFAMTRSVVLPVKALLMNLLTLSGTFGLLMLVFQDARFENLLGQSSPGTLEPQTMVLPFILAFALTTDWCSCSRASRRRA
jgi:hypothetical protein